MIRRKKKAKGGKRVRAKRRLGSIEVANVGSARKSERERLRGPLDGSARKINNKFLAAREEQFGEIFAVGGRLKTTTATA